MTKVQRTQVLPGIPILGHGGIREGGLAGGVGVVDGHGLRRGVFECGLDGARLLQRVFGGRLEEVNIRRERATPLPCRRRCYAGVSKSTAAWRWCERCMCDN